MPPQPPADTPDSARAITDSLAEANGHLSSIARSLEKLTKTLDHYRPAIDQAAKMTSGPVGAIMTMGARARKR